MRGHRKWESGIYKYRYLKPFCTQVVKDNASNKDSSNITRKIGTGREYFQ